MARALMICGSRFRRMQGIIRAVAGAALSRRIFYGDEGYVGRRCFCSNCAGTGLLSVMVQAAGLLWVFLIFECRRRFTYGQTCIFSGAEG